MNDVQELDANLSKLANQVSGIAVKPISMDEEVDESLLEWYESRFKMLQEDGVSNAITYYIERVAKEDINDRTKATIIQRALEYCK